jgi:hypothetical protein
VADIINRNGVEHLQCLLGRKAEMIEAGELTSGFVTILARPIS